MCISAFIAVVLVFPASLAANAATTPAYSNEVGGTTPAARASTSLLNSAWLASVAAKGGTAQAPAILPSGRITSLPTAADGTTTTVTRTRYSAGSSPVYVGPSANQGAGTCTDAGVSMQGDAPRPTALIGGSASCPKGFAYAETGGAGENTTRDAVEFTFSRPVLGFGAWFGDLETRTDGKGVAAVVRLYGVGNVLLSNQVIVPGPNYLPQSSCDNSSLGCGNGTTRWLGFVADPAAPVIRMVVIVGDEDAKGDALDGGMSFIGPTFDLSIASISLVKSAAPLTDTNSDGLIGAGDTLSYSFVVTNTGALPVSSVAITDAAATGISCPTGALAPAAARTCTGSHLVTQTETNSGSVTNTATATAAVYGGSIASAPSTQVTTIPRVSSLAISKTVNHDTYAAVGEVLVYTTTVTNDGNATVTGVGITDPTPGTGVFTTNCGAPTVTMQPHDTIACQANYTVTQADLDTGSVANTASTSGITPTGAAIGPFRDTATSNAIQSVSLDLTKSVSQPTFTAVGGVLNYTVTVSNLGNVTLHNVAVTDPSPGTGVFSSTCATLPLSLAAGASASCTATYQITQLDLNSGLVRNVADASADDPGGVAIRAPQAFATSTAVIAGELGIAKSVTEPTFNAVGNVLHFTITVTNNTNANASFFVTDVTNGSGLFSTTCGSVVSLAPTLSTTCAATYTVAQADLDRGSVINSAHADGTAGVNNPVSSPTAQAESTAIAQQSLELTKTPDVTSFSVVGSVIAYQLVLTNQGNVTLASPQIVDVSPGTVSPDCGAVVGPIAPGLSVSCTASHTVTQADLDFGSVTNTANANAIAPNSDVVAAPSAAAVTPADQTISLILAKSVTEPTFAAVGDDLHYSLIVTNDGNTTLTAATISDAAPGTGNYVTNCATVSATLLPGANVSCGATYTVAQSDLDAGKVTNTAQADSRDPSLNAHPSNTASATSAARQLATLRLVKSAVETSYSSVGDVLQFPLTVTNTGNVTFTSTTVDDSSPGDGAFSTDCGTVAVALAPGASRSCQSSYTITATDLAADSLTNEASASAVAAGGAGVSAVDAQVSVARIAPTLAMTGTGVATLVLIMLALLLAGVVATSMRRKRGADC